MAPERAAAVDGLHFQRSGGRLVHFARTLESHMVASVRTLLALAPALLHGLSPSPSRLARWRVQIKDIFHVDEVPWATLRHTACALFAMGAVEIAYVQPIRDKEERAQRLQRMFTRSRLEGFEAAYGRV